MRAVKYVIDKAKMLNKPVSINISFSTNNGSHRGTSVLETFITDISSSWRTAVSIPIGNEGSAGHHYQAQLMSNQESSIEFFTSAGLKEFYITLWKNFAVRMRNVKYLKPLFGYGKLCLSNTMGHLQNYKFGGNILWR